MFMDVRATWIHTLSSYFLGVHGRILVHDMPKCAMIACDTAGIWCP